MAQLEDALRILALICLFIAAGAMAKFYRTQKRMPWWALVAIGCWIVALISAEVHNLGNNIFHWFETPFVLLGAIACLIGVRPYLRFRKTTKSPN